MRAQSREEKQWALQANILLGLITWFVCREATGCSRALQWGGSQKAGGGTVGASLEKEAEATERGRTASGIVWDWLARDIITENLCLTLQKRGTRTVRTPCCRGQLHTDLWIQRASDSLLNIACRGKGIRAS